MKIEELLKTSLKFQTVKAKNSNVYEADGRLLYIKSDSSAKAKQMLEGQLESLNAIQNTKTIRVPEGIAVLENPGKPGALLVMEYLELKSLGSKAAELGKRLAQLHLHNIQLGEQSDQSYVSQFGFHIPTCCGVIFQGNEWCDDWKTFYATKLQEQMSLIERDYNDKTALDLWAKLKPEIPSFFDGIEVKPSLLHGDLWSGNAAQANGEPVVIDPGCFYGHHEFDLGIAGMFGMPSQFFSGYHEVIPKAKGFEERHNLYQLFHYLNHWNHFGGGYRQQSINIMQRLTRH